MIVADLAGAFMEIARPRVIAQPRPLGEDLVEIGAYQRGSNPLADVALEIKPQLDAFLRQTGEDVAVIDDSWRRALELAQFIT